GRAALADARRMQAEADRLKGRRAELAAGVETFDGPEKKQPLWDAEKSIDDLERKVRERLADVAVEFESVLRVAPDHREAKEALVAFYYDEFERAERRRDPAAMAECRKRIRAVDGEEKVLAMVDRQGSISIASNPSGATVD